MKKKFTKYIIAVIAIATFLVSCSKEDSVAAVSSDPIVGQWMVDHAIAFIPDSDPQTIDNLNGNCPDKNYLNIKKDGTFEEQDVSSTSCAVTSLKGTWKKVDNALQIGLLSGQNVTLDILSIAPKALALRVNNYATLPSGSYVEYYYTKK